VPDFAAIALTAGLVVAGATGAQIVGSPEAWPRTIGAFGQRVADQTGFYVVQTSTYRVVTAGFGWQADTARCGTSELVRCSVVRTFTAFDRNGVRRANVPLLTSIVAATGVSVAWRPERKDPNKTLAFVATRLGIAFGGYVAERMLVDWWRARND
jgi:hypothetical protein